MKTCVIYVLHEFNDNVNFFIENGIYENSDIDWFITINNPNLKLNIPINKQNLIKRIYNRQNIGHDFGAWSFTLFQEIDVISEKQISGCIKRSFIHEIYDYYIFINSSVRGPFLPTYFKNNWINIFTSMITSDVKLAGSTIGIYDKKPHVQSMILVTDRIGLEIGLNKQIFTKEIKPTTNKWTEIILNKEVRYSTEILNAGFNINCLLKEFNGIDYRNLKGPLNNINPFLPKQYFGQDIHPYEAIFCKYNNGAKNPYVDRYTSTVKKIK